MTNNNYDYKYIPSIPVTDEQLPDNEEPDTQSEEATYKPTNDSRIGLRLPEKLHIMLKVAAQARYQTVSSYVVRLIADHFEGGDKTKVEIKTSNKGGG